jgi:hypothetical protein
LDEADGEKDFGAAMHAPCTKVAEREELAQTR